MSIIPTCIIFCSGKGSNLLNIIEKIKVGEINIRILAVISTSKTAGCVNLAEINKIKTIILDKNSEESTLSLEKNLEELAPDFLILAGFLRKIPENIVAKFENRILNIHPSLLPEFGGEGMYGMNVHKAVIKESRKVSGATVHLVTEQYDEGPIIVQKEIVVLNNDTPETLAKRVHELEYYLYPLGIKIFLSKYLNQRIIFNLKQFKDIKFSGPNICIFGGTFDPVHEGHISDIKTLLEIFTTVIIAPTSQNPWKSIGANSLDLRLKMIELVLDHEQIKFSYDLESVGLVLSKEPYVYSYEFKDLVSNTIHSKTKNTETSKSETSKKETNKQIDTEIFWAIGEDLTKTALNWKNWDDHGVSIISLPLLPNVSSTLIRLGEIPPHPALKDYILENNIYKTLEAK